MKKLLLFILLLSPLWGISQVKIHQIESDTITRKFILSDTVIEGVDTFPELKYYSIDSVVKQIVIDSLGIDSLWSREGNYGLVQNYSPATNLFFGANTGDTLTTGTYNLIAGSGNANAASDVDYSTLLGYRNNYLGISDINESFLSGISNANQATTIGQSFLLGNSNAVNYTGNIDKSFIGGYQNLSGSVADIKESLVWGDRNLQLGAVDLEQSLIIGDYNVRNATDVSASGIIGIQNFQNGTGYFNYSSVFGTSNGLNSNNWAYVFANGSSNLYNASTASSIFINGFQNLYSASGVVEYVTASGTENFYSASDVDYSTAFGYRNNYTGISDVDYSFLAGNSNVDVATNVFASFANGFSNAKSTGNYTNTFASGQQNAENVSGDIIHSFLNGYYNARSASALTAVTISGYNNLSGGTSDIIYSSVFGYDNLINGSGLRWSLISGFRNLYGVTSQPTYITVSGSENFYNASNVDYSTAFGYRNNYTGISDVDYSFLSGANNADIATSIQYSTLFGSGNASSATGLLNTTLSGQDNFKNGTTVNYSYAVGYRNFYLSDGATSTTIGLGFQNGYSALGSVSYNNLIGRENAFSANGLSYTNLFGYRNIYQSTSALSNVIAIGRENGYNAVDHSNSIYLGYRQGYTTGAANRLMIGMTADSPLLYGEFDNSLVRVNGKLEVTNTTATTPGNLLALEGNQIVDSGVSSSGIDPSTTNEGLMTLTTTIADNTYTYSSNTSGSDPLILTEGTDIALSRTGNTITIASTASSSPQTLSKSGGTISLSGGGGSVEAHTIESGGDVIIVNSSDVTTDIVVDDIDMALNGRATTATNIIGQDASGWLTDVNIGTGLSLSSGTLSATGSSPWTDFASSYLSPTNTRDVYIPGGQGLGIADSSPSYGIDVGTTGTVRILGDLYDKNTSNGNSGDILTSDGDQIEWKSTSELNIETDPGLSWRYNSATQSESTITTWHNVEFNTTYTDDPSADFTEATTYTEVEVAGWYEITYTCSLVGVSGGASASVDFKITDNGATVGAIENIIVRGAYTKKAYRYLDANDRVDVRVYLNASGTTLDLYDSSLFIEFIKY